VAADQAGLVAVAGVEVAHRLPGDDGHVAEPGPGGGAEPPAVPALGVELVDPRDGRSLLPPWIDAAELVDDTCERAGLLVTSSHSSKDGMVGDQTLLAPAFCATDTDLAEMVERFANALAAVERTIMDRLAHADGGVEP